MTKKIWKEQFEDIKAFERQLARNGTVIRKSFLHVSSKEQKKRFLERLQNPDKNWISLADAREREHFDQDRRVYQDAIRHTATPWAPWYVVPADKEWFTRLVVAAAIVDALGELDLVYSSLRLRSGEQRAATRRSTWHSASSSDRASTFS